MHLAKNPTVAEIARIVRASPSRTAKWLKVKATGDRYFWPAEEAFHRDVANDLGLRREDYDKGLAAPK